MSQTTSTKIALRLLAPFAVIVVVLVIILFAVLIAQTAQNRRDAEKQSRKTAEKMELKR